MSVYESLFEILDEIQTFAQNYQATIEPASNPLMRTVGFSTRFDESQLEITWLWELSLPALKKTLTEYPNRADFVRKSLTIEGRLELAQQLTNGELPWLKEAEVLSQQTLPTGRVAIP